jgi:hypothetical protein
MDSCTKNIKIENIPIGPFLRFGKHILSLHLLTLISCYEYYRILAKGFIVNAPLTTTSLVNASSIFIEDVHAGNKHSHCIQGLLSDNHGCNI